MRGVDTPLVGVLTWTKRSQTRRQEDIEDTLEKSQLLAPESFRFTGSRGSVRDLLLLVLLVRLNLSSLSV